MFHHRLDGPRPAGVRAETVGRQVLDAAFVIHAELGPGLQEHAYREFLADELRARGAQAETEKYLPVFRGGRRVDLACRLDLVADGLVVVEVKAVTAVHRAHVAQLATYLRVSGLPLGFVINFNEALLKNGIRRVVQSQRAHEPGGAREAREDEEAREDGRKSAGDQHPREHGQPRDAR